jgi:pilus assembly protein FimV
MLIAFQRANSDAFLGGNIHRLKAGPILRIPDLSEIKAINRVEADKEVNTQTMEWHRRRSPDVTSSIPPVDEFKQTVSGKIAAADPDPALAEPREVLRLSRGEELPENGINKNGTVYQAATPLAETMPSGWDKLRMMEEDGIARSGSLLEANERIALLEKNISELQRLLELRRLALAELQKQPYGTASASGATGGSSIPTGFEPPSEEVSHSGVAPWLSFSSPTLISMAGASVAEGGATGAISATDRSLVEIAGSVQASPLSPNKPEAAYAARPNSLMEDLTGNIEYLGGALVLLITGIVGVSVSRRARKLPIADFSAGGPMDLPGPFVEDKKTPGAWADKKKSVRQSAGASYSMTGGFDAVTGQYVGDDTAVSNLSRTFDTAPSLPLPLSPVMAASASPMVPVHPAVREVHLDIPDTHRASPSAWYRQGKATPWHEIVNKVDLARAYQEMGDNEAAEQVLREIMREGDIRQQARAKALLSNL